MARPTKYNPDTHPEQAGKLCALGATDDEIADFFGVNRATIYRWKSQHAEFCDAIKMGKEPADDRVERGLYQRAIGYSHEDVDIRVIDGAVTMTPIMKHYPPDTAAAIFWLKNRRKEDWRDKQEVEHDVSDALTDFLGQVAKGSGRIGT